MIRACFARSLDIQGKLESGRGVFTISIPSGPLVAGTALGHHSNAPIGQPPVPDPGAAAREPLRSGGPLYCTYQNRSPRLSAQAPKLWFAPHATLWTISNLF
ncbi:hypothetical protein J6590_017093 [Homalodisca vitripennis]|nr:hypothetical protein J6590_017093 [Homalodisca vitripennis]